MNQPINYPTLHATPRVVSMHSHKLYYRVRDPPYSYITDKKPRLVDPEQLFQALGITTFDAPRAVRMPSKRIIQHLLRCYNIHIDCEDLLYAINRVLEVHDRTLFPVGEDWDASSENPPRVSYYVMNVLIGGRDKYYWECGPSSNIW